MMLGTMLSPVAAGTYNVAIRISNLTDIPTNALGTIVFPQSAKRFAQQGKDAGKYLYEKSVGTILAVMIPVVIFVFCFPSFVVRIVAGSNYTEAVPMIRIAIMTCLLSPFDRFFGIIMDSIGRAKLNFIIILSFTILALTLNYILIGKYGIIGCIYGTLIADLVIFIVRQIILYKVLNVNPLNPSYLCRPVLSRIHPELRQNHPGEIAGLIPPECLPGSMIYLKIMFNLGRFHALNPVHGSSKSG